MGSESLRKMDFVSQKRKRKKREAFVTKLTSQDVPINFLSKGRGGDDKLEER